MPAFRRAPAFRQLTQRVSSGRQQGQELFARGMRVQQDDPRAVGVGVLARGRETQLAVGAGHGQWRVAPAVPAAAADLPVLGAAGDDAFEDGCHGESLEGWETVGSSFIKQGTGQKNRAKVVCVTLPEMRRGYRIKPRSAGGRAMAASAAAQAAPMKSVLPISVPASRRML